MTKFTQTEAAKEIRAIAKQAGMTFKRQNGSNHIALYMFVDRSNGDIKLDNLTFWCAYRACMIGLDVCI